MENLNYLKKWFGYYNVERRSFKNWVGRKPETMGSKSREEGRRGEGGRENMPHNEILLFRKASVLHGDKQKRQKRIRPDKRKKERDYGVTKQKKKGKKNFFCPKLIKIMHAKRTEVRIKCNKWVLRSNSLKKPRIKGFFFFL